MLNKILQLKLIVALFLLIFFCCNSNNVPEPLKKVSPVKSRNIDSLELYARSVICDSNNNLIILGVHQGKWVIAKHTPQGTLDSNFGQNGLIWICDNDDKIYICPRFVADRNGTIYLIGSNRNRKCAHPLLRIWKFSNKGKLSYGFGRSVFNWPSVFQVCADLEKEPTSVGTGLFVDKENRLLVVGPWMVNNFEIELRIWRFLPAGNLDKSFGEDGVAKKLVAFF